MYIVWDTREREKKHTYKQSEVKKNNITQCNWALGKIY